MNGYIYALSNESFPGMLKIGMTRKAPVERAAELSSTGVPTPFRVEFSIIVSNPEQAEHKIHTYFSDYRVKHDREFFTIDVSDVIEFFRKQDFAPKNVPKKEYIDPALLPTTELKDLYPVARGKERTRIFDVMYERLPDELKSKKVEDMSDEQLQRALNLLPARKFSGEISRRKRLREQELKQDQETKNVETKRQDIQTDHREQATRIGCFWAPAICWAALFLWVALSCLNNPGTSPDENMLVALSCISIGLTPSAILYFKLRSQD